MTDRAGPRVLVCDDDAGVRSVITEMVEERDGEVIAETDRSMDAIDLIRRFAPSIVVVDLGLALGSGKEVVEFTAAMPNPPRVIVFTAFDGSGLEAVSPFVEVVLKPDFELLGQRLDLSEGAPIGRERRSAIRHLPRSAARDPWGVDGFDDFYRTLADARPDDTLLAISLAGLDEAAVAQDVRRAIRAQDRMIRRGGALVALLVSGGAAAPGAIRRRLCRVIPDIEERSRSASCGTDAIEAFNDLVRVPREDVDVG